MITIIKSGIQTTIQDLGRFGYQKFGVITSGAMDAFAHRIANILVGNDENLPTLEITLQGPTIQFHKDTLISITGANISPKINDISIPNWRAILVKKGSRLEFGKLQNGCRAYLAVAGGYCIPKIMNSYSTYLRAELGGYLGRKLEKEDELFLGDMNDISKTWINRLKKKRSDAFVSENWSVSSSLLSAYEQMNRIRVIEGKNFPFFSEESKQAFFQNKYRVRPQSDRMGYRLSGPNLFLKESKELLSEAVTYGTIQVPTDGQPIVLLADRQTTGGYPKIGQVATVDFSIIAQSKPGDELCFTKITLEKAQILLLKREKEILLLKHGIINRVIDK
jgi:antagonist of KipI